MRALINRELDTRWPDLNDTRSLQALEVPRLVRLRPNMVLACFATMKRLPARHMIDTAEAQGLITPGMTILESTSGTFGLGLAEIGLRRGYLVHLIGDRSIDPTQLNRLRRLGATVELMELKDGSHSFQTVRLERLHQLLDDYNTNAFWPSQYANTTNPAAYEVFADFLTQHLGHIDTLVGPVGSGGSMCGTARYLRQTNPQLQAIGVDIHNSILFGQPDGPRFLRGAGNSIMPDNVNHPTFDWIHWLGNKAGITATRRLEANEGLHMGGTTGISYTVAAWTAKQNPDATVVAIGPDEGYRYTNTVYAPTGFTDADYHLPDQPTIVTNPAETPNNWTAFHWNRRTLSEVQTTQPDQSH